MLRVIIKTDNAGMACNVGGSVLTTYRTIDVNLPDVEAALTAGGSNKDAYCHTQVVGVEVIAQ